MRVSLTALGMALLVGSLVLAAGGCNVEGSVSATTPTRYNATDVPMEQAWTSGGNVVVDGMYGNIDVVQGVADTVRVTFSPFHYWDPDEEAEARQMLADHLQLVVEPRGDGGVHISTGRSGGTNGIGADIRVELPANFDAALDVSNRSDGPINPGDIDIDFVGAATAVSMATDALGDCSLTGAASVVQTTADCDGQVAVSGVSDNVQLTSAGLETNVSLDLALAAISETATGGTINADDGDVNLAFPAAGNFSILAVTQAGAVNEGMLPAACQVQAPEERSKTITCGTGGPEYHVNACLDGVGVCNVSVVYR